MRIIRGECVLCKTIKLINYIQDFPKPLVCTYAQNLNLQKLNNPLRRFPLGYVITELKNNPTVIPIAI